MARWIRRIRIPFLLDLAVVRDDAEMARLNHEPTIVRHVTGKGGLIHRLIRRRIDVTLRVDANRRLPTLEARDNEARQRAQAAATETLDGLAGQEASPFDREAIATLARFVLGDRLVQPVGVTVQQLIGRMFDRDYVATEESYTAARDVAAVFSSCPVTALRVAWWKLTGRLAASKDLIWRLAHTDPVRIHATAIAMHQVVDSLVRMRAAARTDIWDTTPAEAARAALAAPPRVIRECTARSRDRDGLRDGTLVMFKMRQMHVGTEDNDLAFATKQWNQCPARAIVPRLLEEVWAAAVRERQTERLRPPRTLLRQLITPVIKEFEWINRTEPWYRLPAVVAFLNLAVLRVVLRERNLHDTSLLPTNGAAPLPPPGPDVLRWRTADGSYNDLTDPTMGRAGTRFGRNVPLAYAHQDTGALLEPNPRTVSNALLARRTFIPQDGLNVLAAAWIQFQVHDWFAHGAPDHAHTTAIDIEDPHDDWPQRWRPMRVASTAADPTRAEGAGGPPTYINRVTHWWDASQLYGSDLKTQRRVRSRSGGKLRLDARGRVPRLERPERPEQERLRGIEITGVTDNWWLGLSLMHQLFTLEHNAICDRLHAEFPEWDDEHLFQTARLVNAALITKIHDLEWVPIVLNNRPVRWGLYANWWGVLGKWVATTVGRLPNAEILSGIPGSATEHHGAPYAITEEFVAVYRMHAFMLPDHVDVYAVGSGRLRYQATLGDLLGGGAGAAVDKFDFPDLFYSLGLARPGKIALGNYPSTLRRLQPQAGGPPIDLATVDIFRDRERGVPRYNTFRQLLHLPPIRTFEELNPQWAPTLRKVYGTTPDGADRVDRIDLMVGLYGETPPPGFGFSDTTFRIFILMNSRRMKSDRFYTRDYTPAVYTQAGLDWVADNDMRSVLLRHYPALEPALRGVRNVFGPWADVTRPRSREKPLQRLQRRVREFFGQ